MLVYTLLGWRRRGRSQTENRRRESPRKPRKTPYRGKLTLEASKKFYRDMFGFELKEEGFRNGGNWAIIGVPDRIYLALYEVGEAKMIEQDLQINHFGLHVEDFDALEAKLRAAGVEPTHSADYGASRSLYVNDPSGYEIELSEKVGGGLH